MSPLSAYHARGLAVGAALVLLAPAAAGAADFAYSCEGTTITLACEDGKAGACRTVQASDPAWSVACTGHDLGGGVVRLDCRNATPVGGTPVEIHAQARDLGHDLADAVGTATGTTCSLVE